MTSDSDDELVAIDLDEAERRLMVLVLNEYAGSAQVAAELLPPLIGKSSYDEWGDYVFPLMDSIEASQPLTVLDWARALVLTEFGFGSDMVANARRFGPGRDAYWVLVLRSLQEKIRPRSEQLLIDNAAFSTQAGGRKGRFLEVSNNTVNIELDEDERQLMTATLGAYTKATRRGFELLAPIAGQTTHENWKAYIVQLHHAIIAQQPMRELEWTRALFLAEIGFISSIVGFATEFRGADERGITVLRSLQITINRGKRYLLFSENASYPRIRRPSAE